MFTAVPLSGPQGKDILLRLIGANDGSLTSAVFDTYHLTPNDVQQLIVGIKNNTHVTALRLLDCHLSLESISPLCFGRSGVSFQKRVDIFCES